MFWIDVPGTNADYAKINHNFLYGTTIIEVTLCFWVQDDGQFVSYTSIIHYGHSGDNLCNDLSVTYKTSSGKLYLTTYIRQNYKLTTVQLNDRKKHHICMTSKSSNNGEWAFYKDGIPQSSGFGLSKGKPLQGGGLLYIGQNLNYESGNCKKFEAGSAFKGSVSEVSCGKFLWTVIKFTPCICHVRFHKVPI